MASICFQPALGRTPSGVRTLVCLDQGAFDPWLFKDNPRRGFRIYEVGKNNLSQVTELLKEVSKLDALDRAELIASLLEELDPSPHYVSDDEVLQRLHVLRFGRVKGLSEDELRVLG